MRDMHFEATIWNLFTSAEFFEATARECDEIMEWFGALAVSNRVADLGRNNQIFDKFKQRASDFRRGAEFAMLGNYKFIWEISDCIRGDVHGMMEQPLHSWMTNAEYKEFSEVRISRLMAYASKITRSFNNAMVKGDSFFNPDPDCPERRNDDDGFPGEEIVNVYNSFINWYKEPLFWKPPNPLPEYLVDTSIACTTGDEVPWTGIWYPGTGLEHHSLTFAIKGMRMQPAFRVTKTKEQLKAEGVMCPYPETVAVATTWHPLIPSGRQIETIRELRAKAGEPCPKAGIWQPMDSGAPTRAYEAGESMLSLGSAYGLTVWQWIADR